MIEIRSCDVTADGCTDKDCDYCYGQKRPGTAERAFPRPVVCQWCSNRYRGVIGNDTQGDCCAASVYQRDGQWFINGHYGSTNYDCDLMVFVANPPTAEADPVCDNCIGERLCAGDLKRLDGSYP